MNTFVRVVALTFGMTAAVLLMGSREAQAAPRRVVGDVDANVTVCGNSVGVLGTASSSCDGSSSGAGAGRRGSDDDGLLGNTSARATVCGNSAAVGGSADAGCGTQAGGTDADDQVAAEAVSCGNSVGALGESRGSCGHQRRAPSDAAGGGGSGNDETPATPDPVVVPEAPGTEVLGLEGEAPEALGSGVLPASRLAQTGATILALVLATFVLFGLGSWALTTTRSIDGTGRSKGRHGEAPTPIL
jgi:hypothetical protein